jgi:hypothetical protein
MTVEAKTIVASAEVRMQNAEVKTFASSRIVGTWRSYF